MTTRIGRNRIDSKTARMDVLFFIAGPFPEGGRLAVAPCFHIHCRAEGGFGALAGS